MRLVFAAPLLLSVVFPVVLTRAASGTGNQSTNQSSPPDEAPAPPADPGGGSASEPALLSEHGRLVDQLFDAWKFAEAEEALVLLSLKNPGSAEVLYLDGYQRFLKGDYQGAVTKLKAASNLVPSHRNVRGLLSMAEAAGKVVADHQERRSANFLVRFPPEDEVLADFALETLEGMLQTLRTDLGFRPHWPIVVDIYRDAEDLAAVSPLTVADVERTGTIALCKWARIMATTPRAMRFGYPWMDTLSHELVHYAVSALSQDRVPVWLQEGLAKFLETRWREPAGAELPPGMQHIMARALSSGKLIGFDAMHPSMAKLPRAEDAALAFAEVALAVGFLHESHGMESLRTIIAATSDGADARDAVASATNQSWDSFEKKWRTYMRNKHYKTFPHFEPMQAKPRLRKGAALAARRAPSEDEAILEGDKAVRHLRLGNMLLLRKRPRAAAIQFEEGAKFARPGEWLFPIKLGRTYLALSEPDRAALAVEEFRRLYPEIPWPHLITGKALLARQDAVGAIAALRAALAHNPFDPEVHCALAEAYGKQAEPSNTADRARAQRYCQQLSQ